MTATQLRKLSFLRKKPRGHPGEHIVRRNHQPPPAARGFDKASEAAEETLSLLAKEQLGIKSSGANKGYVPGAEEFPFAVPPIWKQAHMYLTDTLWADKWAREKLPTGDLMVKDRAALLKRLDYASVKLKPSVEQLRKLADSQEIMERDRSYSRPNSVPLVDHDVRLTFGSFQRHTPSRQSGAWRRRAICRVDETHHGSPKVPVTKARRARFCLVIADWLKLKSYYNEYNNPTDPWPHRYILQDITQAFMTMGLFFPGLGVTSIIQEYLASEDRKNFKDSTIFDPVTRSAKIPDIRSRTSCGRRLKELWADWEITRCTQAMICTLTKFHWTGTWR